MLLEALDRPFKFLFSDGTQVRLAPGHPVEMSEDRARRLLDRAKGKVRAVPLPPEAPAIVEPADEAVQARPVYWQSMKDGRIHGPATVTDFAKAGDECWLWIEYRAGGRWVRDFLLRSQAQFDAQQTGRATCPCCLRDRFWLSRHGAVICGTCHPPADPELVVRWLSGRQGNSDS